MEHCSPLPETFFQQHGAAGAAPVLCPEVDRSSAGFRAGPEIEFTGILHLGFRARGGLPEPPEGSLILEVGGILRPPGGPTGEKGTLRPEWPPGPVERGAPTRRISLVGTRRRPSNGRVAG